MNHLAYPSDTIQMYRQLNKASRDYCRSYKSVDKVNQKCVRMILVEREYYEQQLEVWGHTW